MTKPRIRIGFYAGYSAKSLMTGLSMASIIFFLLPNPSWSQSLNEVLITSTFSEFKAVLNDGEWSDQSLSHALIAAAGLNLPAQALLLLEAGADPNYTFIWQNSVTVASVENSAGALQVIIDNGGDINFRSMFDWTPLHHAIQTSSSSYQAIEVLISSGADIEARTSLQITPLHRAAGFCDVRAATLLVEAGADTSSIEKYGKNAYQRAVNAGCGVEFSFLQ